MRTETELMARKGEIEFKLGYDTDRQFEDEPVGAEYFKGYLDALRWILGKEKVICQDKPTCPFGQECEGVWNSIDPQTGRLCREGLKRNFGRILEEVKP